MARGPVHIHSPLLMMLRSLTLEGVPDPVWIIRADGDIDISTTPCLVDALRTARREGAGLVVLDLRATRHVDSSGVHTLLSAQRRLAAAGRRLAVVGDDDAIHTTVPVGCLSEVLETFPGLGAALASERRRRSSDDPPPGCRQPGILIVDDSQVFRDAVRAVLKQRGYLVTGEAGTAAAALHAVGQLAPDGILLDVGLPDATGFDLSAELTRASPAPAVLLTSARNFPNCGALVRACGARGFVLKRQLAHVDLERFWPHP
jgi:anti-anti-sigma factor